MSRLGRNPTALMELAARFTDVGWDVWSTEWKRVRPMDLVRWGLDSILVTVKESPRDQNRLRAGDLVTVLSGTIVGKHGPHDVYRVRGRRERDDRYFSFEVNANASAMILLPIGVHVPPREPWL